MRFIAATFAILLATPALAEPSSPSPATDLMTACTNSTNPDRHTKLFDEATLVSVLGQTPTRSMELARFGSDGKRIDQLERVLPDDMDRTLLINEQLSPDKYAVATILMEGTPGDYVGPSDQAAALDWWESRKLLKLNLVQTSDARVANNQTCGTFTCPAASPRTEASSPSGARHSL